ncbi:uncharacterized protein BT62DRAFT_1080944 [Guyanagaster necrorhizus]|uniref:Uncharacterized protein n=1 Tax=Guyanagaster necrorhizus TaxID=856835 RepID=A0A9P8ALL3_9AGAR|nr:uncharacterized protein BT62DRAFT_1080944 [Guyanagaster necrorhizus MCA 3950]KAG7440328.1 hypothetical protein BT62DRAFT_1080944 [Guyanagaster necrorhizus MCA 3950]
MLQESLLWHISQRNNALPLRDHQPTTGRLLKRSPLAGSAIHSVDLPHVTGSLYPVLRYARPGVVIHAYRDNGEWCRGSRSPLSGNLGELRDHWLWPGVGVDLDHRPVRGPILRPPERLFQAACPHIFAVIDHHGRSGPPYLPLEFYKIGIGQSSPVSRRRATSQRLSAFPRLHSRSRQNNNNTLTKRGRPRKISTNHGCIGVARLQRITLLEIPKSTRIDTKKKTGVYLFLGSGRHVLMIGKRQGFGNSGVPSASLLTQEALRNQGDTQSSSSGTCRTAGVASGFFPDRGVIFLEEEKAI